MTTEELLREIIVRRYGSVKDFSVKANLPYETVYSILRRGVKKAGLQNVLQICEALGISADALAVDQIVPIDKEYHQQKDIHEVMSFFIGNLNGVTLDGNALTETEIQTIQDSIDSALYLIRRRRS